MREIVESWGKGKTRRNETKFQESSFMKYLLELIWKGHHDRQKEWLRAFDFRSNRTRCGKWTWKRCQQQQQPRPEMFTFQWTSRVRFSSRMVVGFTSATRSPWSQWWWGKYREPEWGKWIEKSSSLAQSSPVLLPWPRSRRKLFRPVFEWTWPIDPDSTFAGDARNGWVSTFWQRKREESEKETKSKNLVIE